MAEQFELPMHDADHALLRSIRCYAALRLYAKEHGIKHLAALWGCDEGTAAAKLERRNRNRVHAEEWIAVFRAETHGAVFAAWSEQSGYERAERKQPPQSEEERFMVVARETLGDELFELLRRKAAGT